MSEHNLKCDGCGRRKPHVMRCTDPGTDPSFRVSRDRKIKEVKLCDPCYAGRLERDTLQP